MYLKSYDARDPQISMNIETRFPFIHRES